VELFFACLMVPLFVNNEDEVIFLVEFGGVGGMSIDD